MITQALHQVFFSYSLDNQDLAEALACRMPRSTFTLRQERAARQTLFNDVHTLTRYFCFHSWQHLLDFMITHLELQPCGTQADSQVKMRMAGAPSRY